MGRRPFHQTWIEDLFEDFVLWCTDDDTEWLLGEKLTEKAGVFEQPFGTEQAECVAVYCCQQIEGPLVGKEAIVKVRIQ